MISSIYINNLASYTKIVSFSPNQVNYFYGSNGSGKTTISKLVAIPEKHPSCAVNWNGDKLDTLVYNKDFVKENFGQDSDIRGIFTLGKASKEVKEEIDRLNKDFGEKKEQVEGLRTTYKNKSDELKLLISDIEENCWKVKKKYEKVFPDLWKGVGTKKKFFEKCIQEQDNPNELLSLENLKNQYSKLFQSEMKLHPQIQSFDYTQLAHYESSDLLQKSIVGKEDIDVGALVKKLGKEAVNSYISEESNCPFCLQTLPNWFKESIDSFFDESYEKECQEFQQFSQNYINYLEAKLGELKQVASIQSELINFHELKLKVETITQKIASIKSLVESKIASPYKRIWPQQLGDDFLEIESFLSSYREIIQENNETVNNLQQEKVKLKSLVWHFLSNEVKDDILAFNKTKLGLEKALESLTEKGKVQKKEQDSLEEQLKEKESVVTSVVHTVNEINKTLKLLDFHNFSLAEAQEKGMYKIVREDGSDCKDTLSEGEYNFITFLYFYQLLKGSVEESGLTSDKVVVIDDPISSLDSSVLFMVSNLVKGVIKDCLTDNNGVKQVFILTHNIYFHKEVTFKGNRDNTSSKETFWLVRKVNKESSVTKCESNPVKTTYELLWRELDDISNVNKATIHNTLRRILEYYFNIIGGMSYEKCISEFEGEEKQICKTLVSWINDGSHFINDDLVIDSEPDIIEKYVRVFELIFTKLGHESHYKMMMKK